MYPPVHRLSAVIGAALIAYVIAPQNAMADTSTVTQISYDAGDHVVSVTDPRGLVTSYSYDGLGQLWQQVSPDTGTTSISYDAFGRFTSMTRADGTTTTYGYDALSRLVSVSAGGQTQVLAYDVCTNGISRLCTLSDNTGSTSYSYTPEGWLAGRGFSIAGTTYALGYSYDAVGHITAVNYPDGNQVIYSYTNGVISSVQVNMGGSVSNAATNIAYQPGDGAMTQWTSGNGIANTLSYDSDGRLMGINAGSIQSLGFSYDNTNRITGINNGVDGTMTQSFAYDAMSRLTLVYNGTDNEAFQYDANGNRISQVVNGSSSTVGTSATNNQVTGLSGGSNASYSYDANGNLVTVSGVPTFTYNPFNRLVAASGATYYVNPEGQRLEKTVGGVSTFFAPSNADSLVAENQGGGWIDYLWLNGRLIGRLYGGQMLAIHDDQLSRPEVMTDASQNVVWRAHNFAFDRTVVVSNSVPLNLGFPGQYYDAETGIWNNGFRDYSGDLGRYLESDPNGLGGGINTYAYVQSSPLNAVDPLGLYCLPEWKIRTIAAAIVGAGVGAYYGRGGGGWGVGIGAAIGATINGAMGAVDGLTATTQVNGAATGAIGAMVTSGTKGELGAGIVGAGLGGAISNEMVNEGYSRPFANATGAGVGGASGAALYGWFSGMSISGMATSGLKGGLIGIGMSLGQSAIESRLRAGNDCGCNQQ